MVFEVWWQRVQKWKEVKTGDWSAVKWSEVKWSEVKWSEVKWSEVKWSEVKWSEVKYFFGEMYYHWIRVMYLYVCSVQYVVSLLFVPLVVFQLLQ